MVALAAVIGVFAPRFGRLALAAGGVSHGVTKRSRTETRFRGASPAQALRRKEWSLLVRDPWLMSQTLMQLLYLLPAAFLLWRSFFSEGGVATFLSPILIMAAGQLGGGLAWLAVSGEDAPELIATAPVPTNNVLRAKTEAVLIGVAIVFAPARLDARRRRAVRGAGLARRPHGRGGFRHGDSILVSRSGQTQSFSTTPNLVARRDIRRGAVLERMGRRRRSGGHGNVARRSPRRHGCRDAGRRMVDQPSQMFGSELNREFTDEKNSMGKSRSSPARRVDWAG